ncbi:MAG: FxsA family protein [Pseudomonadota bacterium]
MWLFALFIAVPLIEIALFIQIGGLIGLWPTLLIVVLTAVAGTYLVRSQGAQALAGLRQSMETLNDPSEPLAHGAMILFSGALLLTPGFFTDTVGFLLLVPGVRRWMFAQIKARIRVQQFQYGTAQQPDDTTTIDGEFEDLEASPKPTHRPNSGPSGWTRH